MQILYLHNLSSSYKSSVAAYLREFLKKDQLLVPDLPVEPFETLKLLLELQQSSEINLVIGSSMGGMFAHQLRGPAKILINPAFSTSLVLKRFLGQRIRFYHPRQNPAEKDFLVTEDLIEAYKEVEAQQWNGIGSEEVEQTFAFFGQQDEIISEYEIYLKYYRHMAFFQGGHQFYLKEIKDLLLPAIENVRTALQQHPINSARREA